MNRETPSSTAHAERSPKITWWQAKNLRSARKNDSIFVFFILLFALVSIWSGNMMAVQMSPSGIVMISHMLDQLQMPRQLPNAPLVDEEGRIAPLWSIVDNKKSIISFYAPWCGPCQKELPLLTGESRGENLFVVISSNENPKQVRRQLDNIGLKNTEFLVDFTGQIMSEGKVKSLPTTFLIGKMGRVYDRVVGYSEFRLSMLLMKARLNDD